MTITDERIESAQADSAGKTARSGRPVALAAGIFVIGFVSALIWAFFVLPRFTAIHQIFDIIKLGRIGEEILKGNGFSTGDGPTIRRAPLYPYLIAGIFRLVGFRGHSPSGYMPVFLVQCVFAGLTAVAGFCAANRLFGLRTGVATGLLCAFWPQCLRYVASVDVETTMTLLTAWTAVAMVRLFAKPTPANGALAGLVIGLATLTKPVALLLPPVLIAVFAARRLSGSTRVPSLALGTCVGAMALVCAPWVVRNHIVTGGRFHGISGNAPGEFLRGYVNVRPEYVLLRTPFQGNWDYAANLDEDALLRSKGLDASAQTQLAGGQWVHRPDLEVELEKDHIEGAEAVRRVTHSPLGFLRKWAIQLASFWYLVETPVKSLMVGTFALIAILLAVKGFREARRSGIDTAPVVLIVIYFNVLYAAILAFARYSMPVYPALLILSAHGLVVLISQRRGIEEPTKGALAAQHGYATRTEEVKA